MGWRRKEREREGGGPKVWAGNAICILLLAAGEDHGGSWPTTMLDQHYHAVSSDPNGKGSVAASLLSKVRSTVLRTPYSVKDMGLRA